MSHPPPHIDTYSRRHWLWWFPRLTFVLFIASIVLQLWISERADHAEEQATLTHDLLWLEQALRFNLKHNEETLGHISQTQTTDSHAFAAYAHTLLANNTGLRSITYLDAQQRPRQSMPEGTHTTDDDAQSRKAHTQRALALGKPLYSPPFYNDVHERGEWLFAVHVPSATTGGTVVGLYDIEKTLAEGIPWWLAQRNHISLRDHNGKRVVARNSQLEIPQHAHLQRSIDLNLPGHGVSIWITPIRSPVPLSGRVLSMTLALLAMLLLWSLWTSRKHMQHRLNAERQLQHQHERLQITSRLITMGEMASSLAHEINQPMAAISSYATGSINLIDAGKTDLQEMRSVLARIQGQAQRAGHIIRRIYAFMRRSEPNIEACDLAQIIQEAIDLVAAYAQHRRIIIHTEITAHLPTLQCDKVLLEQALFNLMRNGIEAMASAAQHSRQTTAGANSLSIQAYADTAHLHINITDRGPGIPPEVATHIFEPFYTTKPEGLGMGLNICRSIIEAHHGQLIPKNNPQGGTTFSILLPITAP